MNIALFHTTLPHPGRKPGGVAVAVHRLAAALSRVPDQHVTVFSLSPPPPAHTYHHVRLFARRSWLARRRLPRLLLLPMLLNHVDFSAFDVLHLHGDDWFFVRRDVPTVRTLHGSALDEARTATSWRRRAAQYGIYPLEHVAARLATLPLAVGPRTAARYGIADLADNGVDPIVFRPGTKTHRPSVLFVGTWAGRKRGRTLFRWFTERVVHRVPDATLYMVSDACPPHECVVHVRAPSDAALARLYRRAWVFAYPSVYEGFGIPYLEALASGTAVVCSPNPGAAYVLADGAHGLVADDDVFAERLIALLLDDRRRSELAERGLDRAQQFTWDAVAAQHLQAYRRARLLFEDADQPHVIPA